MTRVEERHVDAAGVRLRARIVRVSLRAKPVLVLHGFTGAIESMDGVIDAFAGSRPVVALDLVGHGGSQSPSDPEAYTMSSCVAQVAASPLPASKDVLEAV